MELEQNVDLQAERQERLLHAEKAGGYLKHQADALDILAVIARDNEDGRYTYAMHSLIQYVARLKSEALHHVAGAAGSDQDEPPF